MIATSFWWAYVCHHNGFGHTGSLDDYGAWCAGGPLDNWAAA